MTGPAHYLNPSDAARRLGVSPKALRLYEERGLIAPVRTAAGWRTYGPEVMARAREIVALRGLGLSLAQVGQVLDGDAQSLAPALAAHEVALERQGRQIAERIGRIRALRAGLAGGRAPAAHDLAILQTSAASAVAFDLPWPWGGERFELPVISRLTFITGPLGSGKTRLARAIADNVPGAVFLGLDRLDGNGVAARARMDADPALGSRVEAALEWLEGEGAAASPALVDLIAALERHDWTVLVVDMVEQGLDAPQQEALMGWLRRRATHDRPLVLMTRSTSILDLEAVGLGEAILYCPANHAPPMLVAPCPGAPGYEAAATCLAAPDVRARTEGVVAWRPVSA